MIVTMEKHVENTRVRARAFEALFGDKPEKIYPHHLFSDDEDPYFIDVFIYALEIEDVEEDVVAAVTNGMSDYPMKDPDSGQISRRELIQYFHECDEDHARKLYEMAWNPLFDHFVLDRYQTIEWPDAPVEGSPWKNAFFVAPLWNAHREFDIDIDRVPASLLWHIPISDEELEYKRKNGSDALLDLMEKAELPWIFDEDNRPPLLKKSRRRSS